MELFSFLATLPDTLSVRIWFAPILLRLTDELVGFLQPGKQLLAVVVVHWDAHEVALADEVRLGAGVAGVQHVGDAILSH